MEYIFATILAAILTGILYFIQKYINNNQTIARGELAEKVRLKAEIDRLREDLEKIEEQMVQWRTKYYALQDEVYKIRLAFAEEAAKLHRGRDGG